MFIDRENSKVSTTPPGNFLKVWEFNWFEKTVIKDTLKYITLQN
jgi:hypothetical protein